MSTSDQLIIKVMCVEIPKDQRRTEPTCKFVIVINCILYLLNICMILQMEQTFSQIVGINRVYLFVKRNNLPSSQIYSVRNVLFSSV